MCLECTADEATRPGHHDIGTEHVLLGQLRENHGVVAQALKDEGVDLEKASVCIRSGTKR